MRQVLVISLVISGLHLIEDFSLFLIGRYTEIHFTFIFIGVILLGLSIGLLARHPKVRKFLGD